MSRYPEEWEFNGEKFKHGNSLEDTWNKDNIYPIVWFEGKVYEAVIKPQKKPKKDRIGLWNVYDYTRKPYWTTVDKVYQIIKII